MGSDTVAPGIAKDVISQSRSIGEAEAFLAGGGDLGRLIAGHDWAATSLGPIAGWSATLKATVGLILRSPVPIVTLWGEDGVMIYNDA